MVKNKPQVPYVVYQNKNEESKSYGKWYAEFLNRTSISQRQLADHIASHGSPYSRDTIFGVLTAISNCVPELIMEGKSVTIDSLGTFYPTLSSRGADSIETFTNENIKGMKMRFLPCNSDTDNLTGPALKSKVSLTKWGSVTKTPVVVNGKVKRYDKAYQKNDQGEQETEIQNP